MANNTKNMGLVPIGDRTYFLRATVAGLRGQLKELGLDSSGLKVDLYLRLTDEGHRLYTDDRDQSDDDQPGDDGGEDGQESSDQGSSDQGSSDQGSSDQGSASPGGAGHKRHRDDGGGDSDGDDNDNDNQGPPPPPPRKIVRVGGAIPLELQIEIMANLNFAQLWNLIMAAPAGYLSDDLNAFLIDANRQHLIDYPPANSDDEGSGSNGSGESGSSDSGSSGSDDEEYDEEDEEEPYRPLSSKQLWETVLTP